MNRKEFAKLMGGKLEKIRKARYISITNMAKILGVDRVTYVNNENGVSIPNFFTLYNLGNQFDVSLDWFILDEAPMLRTKKAAENVPPQPQPLPLPGEIKELLDHMDKIPLLRYEILAQLHRFKEDHQALVEKSMKANAGV
ncbi:MAG: helix-turn-helix domain-containing protein [Candidatus Aminicenantes bacterium]|nr:helix-turn-helix domain-containing protein [Candidatus Aminicenantes bacterium]